MEPEHYQAALEEALAGMREGGLPIGAALFRASDLLGRGRNLRIQQGDPTAHAEIQALRSAGTLDHYADTTLYTTLTPCFLCSGAVILFGIPRVVIGQTRSYPDTEPLEFLRAHGVDLVELDEPESARLLDDFIGRRRDDWLKDIGWWRPGARA